MLVGWVCGVVLGEILSGRGQEGDKQRKKKRALCGRAFGQLSSSAAGPIPACCIAHLSCLPPEYSPALSRETWIQQISLSP